MGNGKEALQGNVKSSGLTKSEDLVEVARRKLVGSRQKDLPEELH
jgi:hypothetical protein